MAGLAGADLDDPVTQSAIESLRRHEDAVRRDAEAREAREAPFRAAQAEILAEVVAEVFAEVEPELREVAAQLLAEEQRRRSQEEQRRRAILAHYNRERNATARSTCCQC